MAWLKNAIDGFKNYEFVAIWLEGLALVLIFIWDRLDNRKQHEETLAQLKVSQQQVEVSLEQVEASHKPVVAFSTASRNPEEAVLDMGGAVGGMIVRCPGGNAEVRNIGSGPAFNIRYGATHNIEGATEQGPSGYLVDILPGENFSTPIPLGILKAQEWEVVFTYESLSGRKYRTKCTINDLVLTNVIFERVTEC